MNSQEGTIEGASTHLVSVKFDWGNDFLDIRFLPNSSTFLALVASNKLGIVENWGQTRVLADLFSPKGGGLMVRSREGSTSTWAGQSSTQRNADGCFCILMVPQSAAQAAFLLHTHQTLALRQFTFLHCSWILAVPTSFRLGSI